MPCLFHALYERCPRAVHMLASDNRLADVLSCNNAPAFLHRLRHAFHSPTQVPINITKLYTMKSRHRSSGGCCLVVFGGRAHSICQEDLCSRLKMLPVLHFDLLPVCVSYHPRESNTEGLSTSILQLFLRHV